MSCLYTDKIIAYFRLIYNINTAFIFFFFFLQIEGFVQFFFFFKAFQRIKHLNNFKDKNILSAIVFTVFLAVSIFFPPILFLYILTG